MTLLMLSGSSSSSRHSHSAPCIAQSTGPSAVNIRHSVTGSITNEENNNLIERLNGTIRERTKVMRGMKSRPTAVEMLEGWTVHYNYFRPHEGLDNRTPAQSAGVRTDLKSWEDVTEKIDVRTITRNRLFKKRERRLTPSMGEGIQVRQLELAGPIPRRLSARRRAISEGLRPARRARLVK